MLFRNTLAQSMPMLSSYAFSVVLAPIMLVQLGLAQFGIWAVTGALALYAGVLDLGISRALARYVAFYDASGDRKAIQECLVLGLVAVLTVGCLAAGAAVIVSGTLSAALGVLSPEEMRIVLLSSVVIVTSDLMAQVLDAVPIGLRQMVPPNVAATCGTTVNFLFSILALVLSTELTDYAVANAAAAVVSLVLAVGSLIYVWSRPYFAVPARTRVWEITRFGLKNQVNWAAEILIVQSDKLVIGLLLGPTAVGAYEIASRVVFAVRSLAVMTVSAIVPTATAAIVQEGRHIIGDFYRRYTTRSVAIAFPLLALTCVSGPFLLTAWLGEAPENSSPILVLLIGSYFISMVTGVGTTVAIADGRPGEVATAAVIAASLNLAATLALTPLFGIWGALGATFLSITVGTAVFLVRFHRIYAIAARDLLRSVGPSAALSIGLCLPVFVWYAVFSASPDSRVAASAAMFLAIATYVLPYWWLASRLQLLPERLSVGWVAGRLRRRRSATK